MSNIGRLTLEIIPLKLLVTSKQNITFVLPSYQPYKNKDKKYNRKYQKDQVYLILIQLLVNKHLGI